MVKLYCYYSICTQLMLSTSLIKYTGVRYIACASAQCNAHDTSTWFGYERLMVVRSHFIMKGILCLLVILVNLCERYVIAEHEEDTSTDLFVIEGKVFPWDNAASTGWQLMTHVMANGGEHYGFLREDGTFIISNVPSGSYMVEVVNPNYVYEPVRVEINSKGKFRARKVNLIQTSQVIQVPYPLKMRPLAPFRYFQVREQWRLTDFLFNPMVLMMVLPLILIMILPKIMNDPETRKEMEQLNNLTIYNMPEMSEVITSFLSGGEKQKSKAVKAAKKRQ